MSKAVLISIRPKWCELIASGKKTIEVRKTKPKMETPFKCYIYQTPSKSGDWNERDGRVIGEFVCDEIYKFSTRVYLGEEQTIHDNDIVKMSCVPRHELREYEGNATGIFGWHISDLVIYDAPKELSEFYKWSDRTDDIRPCQDWKKCEHEWYDYAENCTACAIDYDGTDCPYLKVQRPPQSWQFVEEL